MSDSGRRGVHWAEIGESTFVAGIWFLYWVNRLLGRLPFRVCLYPIVAWYWATRPLARRASLDYLVRMEQATGAIGSPPGWRHSIRHFICFAETLLDKLLAMSGRYGYDRIRFESVDLMLARIDSGRGAVLVTAHMGCLELCRVIAGRRRNLRLNVLVHTAHAERFNRLIRRVNPDAGLNLIQVTEVSPATAVQLSQRIEAGEFVAIAGDRVPVGFGRTTQAPFLGTAADFPVGPYVLAALLKCPLYLMACLREGDGHVVRFEQIADSVVLPRGRRDAALAALASDYAARLQVLLCRAPYEWFNFYPFWDSNAHDRPAP
ncbi:acyltransferase [Solimonas sp. K1W22B-7]|uniref:LpxL/LpxP family acyltransferase n=1 Tax=Solimonas sp. K1W22B-7 TaxID=2303331 RepID=UPI000E336CD3|nr:acyltransferase [Solimonas sp. K1W22B-7]AXQ29297.1 acyltransferase [Solimonas sp. K1W22B-7]